MPNFILKNIAPTTFNIQLSRAKVGFARKLDDGWFAKITVGGEEFTAEAQATAQAAFHEVVRLNNRFNITGDHNASDEDVQAGLDLRREASAKYAAELQADADKFNAGMPAGSPRMVVRRRTRRFSI